MNIYNKFHTKFSIVLPLMVLIFNNSCNKKEEPVYDPCIINNCNNAGICIDGTCNCDFGYYGDDCSNQITPSSIEITKIIVDVYPQTNGGAGWDDANGPDMYLELINNSDLIYTSETKNNLTGESVTYIYNMPFIVAPVTDQYILKFYDYDTDVSEDYIGSVTFYFYNNTNHFPSILHYTTENWEFEIYVNYNF